MARSGPVGVGFIGTGMISDTYLENLTSFPDVKVVILGDLDQQRARVQAEKYQVAEWGSNDDVLSPPRRRDHRQPHHPRRPCPGRFAGDRRRQARLDGEADQHRPVERARPARAGRRGRTPRRRRPRHGARPGRADRPAGHRARRHRRAAVRADGDAVRRDPRSSIPTRSSSTPRAPGRCSTWARTTSPPWCTSSARSPRSPPWARRPARPGPYRSATGWAPSSPSTSRPTSARSPSSPAAG